jgi:hypothetical protein
MGDALRSYGRSMAARPIDPSGRYRDVAGRAHAQLVEALSRQAATIRGPDQYTRLPGGGYSREDLLRMASDRHFLAQLHGQVGKNSFSNYLKDVEQLYGVVPTEAQDLRFSASTAVETHLTRVLREAGVLDWENGRYVDAALPRETDIPPPPDGTRPVSPVLRPEAKPQADPYTQPHPRSRPTASPFGVPNS